METHLAGGRLSRCDFEDVAVRIVGICGLVVGGEVLLGSRVVVGGGGASSESCDGEGVLYGRRNARREPCMS